MLNSENMKYNTMEVLTATSVWAAPDLGLYKLNQTYSTSSLRHQCHQVTAS